MSKSVKDLLLGLKINKVEGNFYCVDNQLTSLEGSPETVGGNFDCDYNKLTSLKGGPETVGGTFDCNYNQLTSLEGSPKIVGGDFGCYDNSKEFTKEEVRKYIDVKGRIIV